MLRNWMARAGACARAAQGIAEGAHAAPARGAWLGAAALALCLFAQQPAWAQEGSRFPTYPGEFAHGSGFYLSWFKLPLFWLLFLLWVRTLDWINQDGQRLRLEYRRWNQIAFFSFMGVVVLLWLMSFPAAFWVGFPLMLVAYAVPFMLYVLHRNGLVTDELKVFTGPHLRFWFSERLKPLGIKVSAEPPREEGPPVELTARGGATERDDTIHLLTAKQSPAFNLARVLLDTAFSQRADAILLDYTQQTVSVRYQIDGVWHNAENQDRETGDAVLAVLKTISALNVNERRARQQGTFGAEFEKKQKHVCRLISQGTRSGERVLIQVEDPSVKRARLPELGMREKMQDQFKGVLEQRKGLILVSAPPGNGLSSLLTASVAAVDRYVRGAVAVEEAGSRELEVENVPVTTYDAAAGQTAASVLPKLIREYPDVYVVTDLTDVEAAAILFEQASVDRLVISTVQAKECAEAVARVLALQPAVDVFAEVLVAVLNQRLIRKLCSRCKEPYPPPPQVLEQLGIPAGRIEAFYRPPQPPAEEKDICPDCRGIGYRGRTGIFELLVVDAPFRSLLAKQGDVTALRQAARRAGMRSLQEEGLVLVVKGTTSLPELMRVLKENP